MSLTVFPNILLFYLEDAGKNFLGYVTKGIYKELHAVTSKKAVIFIVTAVKTSNFTYLNKF
jgi:hypothetical protein